jgi:tetrahydromethanopterin S-methyltransferase subunit D
MSFLNVPFALVTAITGGSRKILTGKLGSETQLIGFAVILLALLQAVAHGNRSMVTIAVLFCALMFLNAITVLVSLLYATDKLGEMDPQKVYDSPQALPTMLFVSLIVGSIVGGALLYVITRFVTVVAWSELAGFTFALTAGYTYITHYLLVKDADKDDIL